MEDRIQRPDRPQRAQLSAALPFGARGHAREALPVLGLLLLGSLAFFRLTVLPVFEDEGSQLRWIYRAIEAGEWLLPLTEGKPLEAWPMVPLIWFGLPPLLAVRAVHVLAGMIAAVLTYRLARLMSDELSAYTSGALFAICPLVVCLQRLALSDMLLCTAGVWVLVSTVRLIDSPTWWRSGVLATGLLLAALSKLPVGFMLMAVMPLALLLAPPSKRELLFRAPQIPKLVASHVPAAVLALVVCVVAAWRARRGQDPGFGLHDLVGIAIGAYQGIGAAAGVSRPGLIEELTAQLSWPVVLVGLIGLAAAAIRGDWRQRWLIAVGLLPMLAIGLATAFWFSRYLLVTLPPLIIAAVSGWRVLMLRARPFGRVVGIGLVAVCAALMGWQSAWLILDPRAASWSRLDRSQYFESWSAGYGYPEAARFILQARPAPAVVYSLDGHSAYQLQIYLPRHWHARVRTVFYGADGAVLRSADERLANVLSRSPVWIVVSAQLLDRYLESSFGKPELSRIAVSPIAMFDKPGSRTQLALYQIAPRQPAKCALSSAGTGAREGPGC